MAQKVIVSLKEYNEVMAELATAQINLKVATQEFQIGNLEQVKNLAFLAERVVYLDEKADRFWNYLTDDQINRLANRSK